MRRRVRVELGVTGHRELLEDEAVQAVAKWLQSGIDQADNDAASVRRGFKLQLGRRGQIRGLGVHRAGRAVHRVVVVHGGDVGVAGELLAGGVRGRLVIELEAVGIEAVDAAGDFGPEKLGQVVNLRAGLEADDEFVGDQLALVGELGGLWADELSRILYRGAEYEESGAGVTL